MRLIRLYKARTPNICTPRKPYEPVLTPSKGFQQRKSPNWKTSPDLAIGVDDGARTRDPLDHNQVLYQLSYNHHASGR